MCDAGAEHPALPPGAAARSCLYRPSMIAGNGTHQHQLITPFHYTDELDRPQSIALMKCHLLKSHPLREARWLTLGQAPACWGTSRHPTGCLHPWGMPEPRLSWYHGGDGQSINGWAEHHRMGRASSDGQNIIGQAEYH